MGEGLYSLLPAFIVGAALGLLYFGGLWLSVRRLGRSKRPALWMMASFWLRTGLLLAGFYLIMDGQWQRLLAAAAGFMLMRVLLVHHWGKKALGFSRTLTFRRDT